MNAYSNKHIFLGVTGITGRLILFKFENVFNMLRVLCDDRLCAVVKVAGFKYFYHGVSICSFSLPML